MKTPFPLKEYLGTKELYLEMLRLGLPISIQSLIAVGMNMIDTVMLGSMGDAQLSAASLAGQYVTMALICAMAVGMGATVLATRFYGMGDLMRLKETVTIMLRCELVIAITFTAVGVWFSTEIMKIFSRDTDIIRCGVAYLDKLLPVYTAMAFSQGCTIVLRSAGKLWVPLLTSAASLGVNAFFNWVFIFGHLGAARMEIAGAALATTIAWLVQLAVICGYFFFVEKNIGYRLKDLRIRCRDLVGDYLKISIPVLVSDSLLGLGNSAVSMVMGHMGATFSAANSVTMVVQQLSTVLHHGAAGASGIITGHTMGRGESDKAQKQGYVFVFMGLVLGCVAALGILLLRGPVIDYYHVSPEAKAAAWQLMNAILTIVVFQSVNGILTKGVLRAGGDTRFLMVGDVLFLWAASIPLGALAGLVWGLSAFWVYFLLKVDQVIKCVWCIRRLHSRKWMKKISGDA